MLKTLVSTLILATCLSAQAKTFPYPTEATSPWGKDQVAVDLLELHKKEIKEATPSALQSRNDEMLKYLKTFSKSELYSANETTMITRSQAQAIHALLKTHPIVSEDASAKYDQKIRRIGYCFGRAAYVHLELLRRGVDPRAIGKIFAIGDLMYDKRQPWDYHVATIVRAKEGGWWVIDALRDDVTEPTEWTQHVAKWSPRKDVRFYFTDAVKFQPTAGGYAENRMYPDYYKGFFKDLDQWFQENPVGLDERFVTSITSSKQVPN